MRSNRPRRPTWPPASGKDSRKTARAGPALRGRLPALAAVAGFAWTAVAGPPESIPHARLQPGQAAVLIAACGAVDAISPEGEGRPLAPSDALHEDETVHTGEHARAQIAFADGTVVSLAADTAVTITAGDYRSPDGDDRIALHIERGLLRVNGGSIARRECIGFTGPATDEPVAVRGSFYVCRAGADRLEVVRLGTCQVVVECPSGTVELDSPSVGTVVLAGEPPRAPTEMALALQAGVAFAPPESRRPVGQAAPSAPRGRAPEDWGPWGEEHGSIAALVMADDDLLASAERLLIEGVFLPGFGDMSTGGVSGGGCAGGT